MLKALLLTRDQEVLRVIRRVLETVTIDMETVNSTAHVSYGSLRDVPIPLANISEGGVALGTNRTSEMTGPVQLRMQLPGLNRVLEAKGEFVWMNDTGRVGIRFTTIAPLVKSELDSWLSRQLEIAAPNLVSAGSGRLY